MKTIQRILLSSLCSLALGVTEVHAAQKLKVCVAGSLTKPLTSYERALANGIEFSFVQNKIDRNLFEVAYFDYEANSLDAGVEFDKMLQKGCHAALGFDFTNDLKVVLSRPGSRDLPIISLYAILSHDLTETSNIRSFQATPRQQVEPLFKFAKKKLGRKPAQILIVTSIDFFELKLLRNAALEIAKEEGIVVHSINKLDIDADLSPAQSMLGEKSDSVDIVFLFVRTKQAAQLAEFSKSVFKPGKEPFIMGSKFFGSKALPFFHNMLEDKSITAYFTHQINPDEVSGPIRTFKKAYASHFKTEAMGISILGYDAMTMITRAALSLKQGRDGFSGTPDELRKRLLTALDKIEFKGLSNVSLKPGFRFSAEKVFVLKSDRNGYAIAR